jgi:hypothetical protein
LKRNPFEDPQPHPEFTVSTVAPLDPIRHEYERPEPLERVTVEFGDPVTPEPLAESTAPPQPLPAMEARAVNPPESMEPVTPHTPGNAPELPQVEPAPSEGPSGDLQAPPRPQVEFGAPDAMQPVQVNTSTPEPVQPIEERPAVSLENLPPLSVNRSDLPASLPPMEVGYKMPEPLPPLKPTEYGQDRVDVEALLADIKPRKEVRFLRMTGGVSLLSEEGY